MMIWKYVLERRRVQTIRMPKGAQILSLQTQATKPCLWAAFEHEDQDYLNFKEETRTIVTLGTNDGANVSLSSLTFLGTYQIDNGNEVYHVFEKT